MVEPDKANTQTDESTRHKSLRLWPGVVIVLLQWLAWLGAPLVVSGIMAGYVGVFGRLFGGGRCLYEGL